MLAHTKKEATIVYKKMLIYLIWISLRTKS